MDIKITRTNISKLETEDLYKLTEQHKKFENFVKADFIQNIRLQIFNFFNELWDCLKSRRIHIKVTSQ